MSKIHFYDAETGYIHYVSEVIPNLECRVYDPVSNLEDVMVCRNKAVQFVPQAATFFQFVPKATVCTGEFLCVTELSPS